VSQQVLQRAVVDEVEDPELVAAFRAGDLSAFGGGSFASMAERCWLSLDVCFTATMRPATLSRMPLYRHFGHVVDSRVPAASPPGSNASL
jgi:hypothetical protein